jgi:transcriptional regulator of arginine metabolism
MNDLLLSGPKARRATLRKLLSTGAATTQTELCEMLAQRGHRATQSTISRDLKLLGAERRHTDDGTIVYRIQPRPRRGLSGEMVTSIEHNEIVVVIRTEIGRAQAVGLDLDAMGDADILGTLAGDDTVLVIPRSTQRTTALAGRLKRMVGMAG